MWKFGNLLLRKNIVFDFYKKELKRSLANNYKRCWKVCLLFLKCSKIYYNE